ncbi:hypothetical protein [Arthrobacter sp. zg-Y750]|uniref:hypothetical protein n=1 Tax=Arthrobacter sp. zg-Y750 TaxID=2894189 RepID=UPI001E4A5D8C|nr:hypothetical protein [Arthrobacter sp. zg-Y750]MCC9178941.1 hypothetical protein [Arthrobacter sp. zg-Y750]
MVDAHYNEPRLVALYDEDNAGLKFPPADLLERLLQEAGFSSADWYGDWDGSPFMEATSRETIIAARCQTAAETTKRVRGTG